MAQRYRHQIVIEKPTESASAGYGEVSSSWSTLITCWASMENRSSGEIFEAGSQVQTNDFVFETYYNSSVTTKHRINYGTRYFDIEGVENIDNKGRKMRIHAKETDENV